MRSTAKARRRRPNRTRRRRPTPTPRHHRDRTRPRPPDRCRGGYTGRPTRQRAERCPRGPGGRASGGSTPVQLRVVTDQPWDVPSDVLVVPVGAGPTFDGPLGELDQRAGGALQPLGAGGGRPGKRYATAITTGGKSAAGRLPLSGLGDSPEL